jgi:hypothetical protein
MRDVNCDFAPEASSRAPYETSPAPPHRPRRRPRCADARIWPTGRCSRAGAWSRRMDPRARAP